MLILKDIAAYRIKLLILIHHYNLLTDKTLYLPKPSCVFSQYYISSAVLSFYFCELANIVFLKQMFGSAPTTAKLSSKVYPSEEIILIIQKFEFKVICSLQFCLINRINQNIYILFMARNIILLSILFTSKPYTNLLHPANRQSTMGYN